MKHILAAFVALALASLPAVASEATFDRTLAVSGHVELSVATGSGNIHISHGSANQIHIFGRVKGGWGTSEQRVKEIAANPPVEQTGNIVRVGGHHEGLHNISIDYEIQAPADVMLEASSGSGDLTIDGVGDHARLSTGSGNIHASGIRNGFNAGTGSGNIWIEQIGEGDVKAETGSGNMELRNLRGTVRAGTGSGDIRIGGAPIGPWKLETGSGNIDYWPSTAPFTLDASTGSGTVHSDKEILMQGTTDRHHILGKINGGGPVVRIETGSGDIRVH